MPVHLLRPALNGKLTVERFLTPEECQTIVDRVDGFDGIQFTKYSHDQGKPGDHYGPHKDTRLLADGTIRKLSFTIQLSDSASYEGGDVVLYDSFTDFATLDRARGSISFFPSYTIHEVTPVSRGLRYSLVGWATGPSFA
ncbi:MAG TPA: 2OG-Fe(II) oxygenase [Casimicrobiaceae bacterium]